LGRLVVALDRRRLPVAARPFVSDLDEDDLGLVGRPAGDDEGLGHPQRRDPGLELHADTLEPQRAALAPPGVAARVAQLRGDAATGCEDAHAMARPGRRQERARQLELERVAL